MIIDTEQFWCEKKAIKRMPYHGKIGIVMVRGNDKPRNHLTIVDGKLTIISCGNINEK